MSNPSGKDKVGTIGQMIARLGFVITFLIGLAIMFGVNLGKGGTHIHMTTGLLFLVGTLLAVARYAGRGAGRGPLIGAAVAALIGAGLGGSLMGGDLFTGVSYVHPLLMIAGQACLEIGCAKAKRA
jgi:hypothetical protein